jgi:hypothetical protein
LAAVSGRNLSYWRHCKRRLWCHGWDRTSTVKKPRQLSPAGPVAQDVEPVATRQPSIKSSCLQFPGGAPGRSSTTGAREG